ncbi:hypothetical protein MNBD_GAMMA09-1487 [hydrothermal vent metagenome]|uniref:Transmembrane protein n=1 Tax=hydrothermal vent metagenome TaxID=652676 RepID=A0A3B0XJA7_9ZZZZ
MNISHFYKIRSTAPVWSSKLWCKVLLPAVMVFLCTIILSGNAQAIGIDYKIKAAYLYQFTKFTQWPVQQFSDKNTPIRICVLGRSPFGNLLDIFSSKTSQNRSLSIKYLPSLKNILNCHVVFISRSEEKRLTQILHKIAHSPVLTVSDMDDFVRRGGIIGFVPKRKKVGIEINIGASSASGAKLSSKLLEIATLIKNGPETKSP